MPDDLAQVLSVGRAAWTERFARVAGPTYAAAGLARHWTAGALALEIAAGEVLVACAGGRVVGLAAVRSGGLLARLYVDPAAQGRGVGVALLGVVLGESTPVHLSVLAANAEARGFYRAHGFVDAGERVDPDGGPPQRWMTFGPVGAACLA